jgi:hypothetical protein
MIRPALLTAIGLLIATSAQAKPSVSTPPLPNNPNGSTIALCQAANTGTKAAMMSAEIVDLNSHAVLVTVGPFNIPPNGQINFALSNPTLYDKFCRVTGLPRSKVTILFAEFDSNAKPILSVTAP